MRTTFPRRPGCLAQLALLAVIGAAIYFVPIMMFAPFAFTMGGHFHLLPMWQGIARIEGGPGGDYEMLVNFQPSSARSKVMADTSVSGSALLCTPRGERYVLRLRGSTPGRVWKNRDGEPVTFTASNRPALTAPSADSSTLRPRLLLQGQWRYPNLMLDDEGSFANDFLSDGALDVNAIGRGAPSKTHLTIALHEGGRAAFEAACRAIAHK